MEQSPLQPTPVGAFRFNTDSSKLEYYDGNQWVNVTSTSPEVQTGGTRGLFMGGETPGYDSTIDYINIDSTGDAYNTPDGVKRMTRVASTTEPVMAPRPVITTRSSFSIM